MPETRHNPAIEKALESISPITLGEMDSIKLMNRVDTKYVTDEKTLVQVLEDAAAVGYRALIAEGTKISPYNSIYYDTPELKTFLDHRNQRLRRQKVRTRVYVNSGDAFLEIKRKNNKGRTKKKRTRIPAGEMMDFSKDRNATEYLTGHSDFSSGQIAPILSTAFDRITLVNAAETERLTIDTHLVFKNFRTGKETSLQDAVIIEIKQDGMARSQMKDILLEHRVKPLRVSKYCIAVTLTEPSVRSGRFKEKVHAIEKIINKRIQVI